MLRMKIENKEVCYELAFTFDLLIFFFSFTLRAPLLMVTSFRFILKHFYLIKMIISNRRQINARR